MFWTCDEYSELLRVISTLIIATPSLSSATVAPTTSNHPIINPNRHYSMGYHLESGDKHGCMASVTTDVPGSWRVFLRVHADYPKRSSMSSGSSVRLPEDTPLDCLLVSVLDGLEPWSGLSLSWSTSSIDPRNTGPWSRIVST